MMKGVFILLVILLGGMTKITFGQGIEFREGTYEEIQQLARQENKLIFIDFYTEWCGPCKGLAESVFPLPEVGAYFNKVFISSKQDAEKGGKILAKKYGVTSYPTLVFLNHEGEVVNKITGAVDAETLIEAGKKAVDMVDDPNNLTNLKKGYLSHRQDEAFLKMYLEKMVEYKESPFEAVEDYLKVQTGMKENSAKMMEFLIQYGDYLMVGGEAERVLEKNYDEFWDIATRVEEKKLQSLKGRMTRLTMDYAIFHKNVLLYEVFLDRWVKMENKPYYQDYNGLKLDLYLLKDEKKTYRKEAVEYLDSVVTSRSISDIQGKDQERYDDYCKENSGSGWMQEKMKASMKNLDAKLQIRAIIKVGNELLKMGKNSDLKHINKWIAYGHELLPEQYTLLAFEAKVFYRQGDRKKAIETQRVALSLVSSDDKKVYPGLKEALDKMENGTF